VQIVLFARVEQATSNQISHYSSTSLANNQPRVKRALGLYSCVQNNAVDWMETRAHCTGWM